MKFYEWNGAVYKELCSDERSDGVYHWLISCDCTTAPVSIASERFSEMTEVSMPSECVSEEATTEWMQQRQSNRLQVIESLTEDSSYIIDKKKRSTEVQRLAKEHGISERTISRWYYRWLVKGENGLLPSPRCIALKQYVDTDNYEWAINKYYYSSRRMSLRDTYEAMLLARYTDGNGNLIDGYPTYNSFLHYYRKNHSSPNIGNLIKKHGKSYYARNIRPLYGKSTDKVNGIGVYEMDATIADIYLVSENDRTLIVGRPCIYLAVDVASQLIAGVYVGFEQGESAVVECLRNAAENKVEYCKRYGITIEADDWLAEGMPGEVITDRGREFFGGRMDEICRVFSITETVLPAYRPELKGIVEKAFDLLRRRSSSLLYRKGVVAPDSQQRGAPDYRLEAKLTLREYTQVIIYSIIYINNRVLGNYIRTVEMATHEVQPTPKGIWQWHYSIGSSHLTQIDTDLHLTLMPRGEGKITRYGLCFDRLYYQNRKYDIRCAVAGFKGLETVTVAFDPLCTDCIWLYEKGDYVKFTLADSNADFKGLSYAEAMAFTEREKAVRKELRHSNDQLSVITNSAITAIGRNAEAMQPDMLPPSSIIQGGKEE